MPVSIFLDIHQNRDKVTFLFLEIFGNLVTENPDIDLYSALAGAYKSLYKATPSHEMLEKMAVRLKEATEKSSDEEEGKRPAKKDLGTEELEWLGQLDSEGLCLYAADYDIPSATLLYSEYDFSVAVAIARLKQQHRWKTIVSGFEQAMYAFGGGYKGSGSNDGGDAYDVTPDAEGKVSDQSLAALRQMKFL